MEYQSRIVIDGDPHMYYSDKSVDEIGDAIMNGDTILVRDFYGSDKCKLYINTENCKVIRVEDR